MKKVHAHDVGLIVGTTVSVMHVIWSLVVFFGLAHWYLDFMLSMHFVSNPFVIQPFDWGKAIMLWIITFVIGYLIGWVVGIIWNMVLKKK